MHVDPGHLDGHDRLRAHAPTGSAKRSTSSKPIRAAIRIRGRELRALPVRLAAVEPVQREGAAAARSSRCSNASAASPGTRDARLVFVGHSMGGLVARYYVDVLGGHEVTSEGHHARHAAPRRARRARCRSSTVCARGSARSASTSRDLARSLPALHQLLPGVRVHRVAGPACQDDRDDGAGARHGDGRRRDALPRRAARRRRPRTRTRYDVASDPRPHPADADDGARSSTAAVEAIRTIRDDRGEDEDQKGDGTVPRLSAAPYGVASDSPVMRYVMEKHGALPKNEPRSSSSVACSPGTSDDPAGRRRCRSASSAKTCWSRGSRWPRTIEAGDGAALEAEHRRRVRRGPRADAGTRRRPRRTVARPQPSTALAPAGYELRVSSDASPSEATVVAPFVVLDPANDRSWRACGDL